MPTPAKPKLVLASASPRRRNLLASAGIVPDLIDPCHIDEGIMEGETPIAHVKRLAREKAETAAKKYQNHFVLAADTVVTMGRRILGKPEGKGEAADFLKKLSGRRHRVVTSVALIVPDGRISTKTVSTTVHFKRLTDAEIAWYLSTDEWRGKAGGYAIQGHAASLVTAINGSYTNVVGLPLYETLCLLGGAGYPVPGR